MPNHPLTLMIVHAHPDDEVISTGGVLLRYAEQGIHTVLVTCTRGEEGEIVVPEWDTPENKARLADMRADELAQAVELLKIDDFYQLGYRDSGMINTPANDHPDSFNQADLDVATGRLVELVRRHRPQVLISYNEEGGYGHPDHIAAHKITVAAFDAAGDPERYPDAGEPWAPLKLYYTAFRRSIWRKAWEAMREQGLETPLDDPDFDLSRYVDDARTTTSIEITRYLPQKLQALMVHRTQIKADWGFLRIPAELREELLANEDFVLVESRIPLPHHEGLEADLFAGLRDETGATLNNKDQGSGAEL